MMAQNNNKHKEFSLNDFQAISVFGGWDEPSLRIHGATSVDMTKHFYDVHLHDLIYMTSIYMTQLLHDTWLHEKHLHEMHLHDKSNEYMTEQNHDTH